MREVIFYRTADGNCPVKDFLRTLPSKQRQKATWVIGLVEEIAIVPRQYFKKLTGTDDIWEIRVDSGSDTFRLLGFLHKGNLVVLTNGFAKKSQQTPRSEIVIAEERKKDYLRRVK